MSRRSLFLIRSIAFGALTKIAGALVVFIAIPIAAHALPTGDYATFLRCISVFSFAGLAFGILAPMTIRDLSRSAVDGGTELSRSRSETFGLYVIAALLVGTLGVASTFLLPAINNRGLIAGIVVVSAVQGALLWADAYRVALRSDHISSLWQLAGNIAIIATLNLINALNLSIVVLAFFIIPLITQLCLYFQLSVGSRLLVRPVFDLSDAMSRLKGSIPIAINSASEYIRIFGMGVVISATLGDAEFARYVTMVYLVSRLVNPISLITRPLMPASVDAIHHNDSRWLTRLKLCLLIIAALALSVTLLIGMLGDSSILRLVLPGSIAQISKLDFLSMGLLLWGFAFSALVAPFYHAAGRSHTYAMLNGSAVVTAGLAGTIATVMSGSATAMLAAMGFGAAAGAIVILTHLSLNVLRGQPRRAS